MSPTVLVIDDEPPIRKLLRMGLSTQGYAILEAPNGATAREVLGREGVDLVLLDLGLPTCAATTCCGRSGRAIPACRWWCCRAATTRSARSRPSISVPTTTSPSRSAWPSSCPPPDALRHQLAQRGERPCSGSTTSASTSSQVVKVDDAEVRLTPREYDFLRVLVLNAGKVLTHAQLLHEVSVSSDPQYLRVYCARSARSLRSIPSGRASFSPRPASAIASGPRTTSRT